MKSRGHEGPLRISFDRSPQSIAELKTYAKIPSLWNQVIFRVHKSGANPARKSPPLDLIKTHLVTVLDHLGGLTPCRHVALNRVRGAGRLDIVEFLQTLERIRRQGPQRIKLSFLGGDRGKPLVPDLFAETDPASRLPHNV